MTTAWFVKKLTILLLLIMGISHATNAQDISVVYGKKQIPITEYFTLSLKVRGKVTSPITSENFPELTGFKKSNIYSKTYKVETGNKTFTEEVITQNYAALQEGKYVVKPFNIKLGSKNVIGKGLTIQVLPEPVETNETVIQDGNKINENITSAPFKSISYLSLETNKKQIYAGEGVQVQLFFYLASAEQGLLDFYQFGQQFMQLNKKLKVPDVWEDVTLLNEEKPDTLKLNNKEYIRFKLYESILYPLGAKHIKYPSLNLNMLVREKDQQYAAIKKEEQVIAFASKPLTIGVRSLPPYPNREAVPVGVFELHEGINQSVFKTEKSFTYTFEIRGTGNFATVTMPEILQVSGLEIFAPLINQENIIKSTPGAKKKQFKYTILPKIAGSYKLGNYFQFPYFNPATGRYDTLKSDLEIRVRESDKDIASFLPEKTDDFYKLIQGERNTLESLHEFDQIKLYTNVVVLFLLCASLFLFLKK